MYWKYDKICSIIPLNRHMILLLVILHAIHFHYVAYRQFGVFFFCTESCTSSGTVINLANHQVSPLKSIKGHLSFFRHIPISNLFIDFLIHYSIFFRGPSLIRLPLLLAGHYALVFNYSKSYHSLFQHLSLAPFHAIIND